MTGVSRDAGVSGRLQIESDWPQMGQMWDFWAHTCTETDFIKSQLCPIWGQSDQNYVLTDMCAARPWPPCNDGRECACISVNVSVFP